jgi:flavin reductase (DIM6/NTAB) family NADH-FMN oxidoreductase RutF
VSFECKATQIIQLTDASGTALDTHVVFAEGVGVHIETDLIHDGVYNTGAAQPIFPGDGPGDYFTISKAAQFRMTRP